MPLFRLSLLAGQQALRTEPINFNSGNTDTAISIPLPSGYSRYLVTAVRISGASSVLTTSTFGLYTAASAGGTAILGATACTVSSTSEGTNNNSQNVVPATANTQSYNGGTLYFRVITPQGTAATATVTLIIIPLS